MVRLKSEVGHKFLRGIQSRFAPFHQFSPVGFTGAEPIYDQPKRYPLPIMGRLVSESMNRDLLYGINDARRRMGLADPGLNNSKSLAMPLDSDPAVQAQSLVLRPRTSSDGVRNSMNSMSMFSSR